MPYAYSVCMCFLLPSPLHAGVPRLDMGHVTSSFNEVNRPSRSFTGGASVGEAFNPPPIPLGFTPSPLDPKALWHSVPAPWRPCLMLIVSAFVFAAFSPSCRCAPPGHGQGDQQLH
jgi:hypothetical protein